MSPNADIQISALKCLPIAGMPILKKSADIADADINIGTPLHNDYEKKVYAPAAEYGCASMLAYFNAHLVFQHFG